MHATVVGPPAESTARVAPETALPECQNTPPLPPPPEPVQVEAFPAPPFPPRIFIEIDPE